MGLFAVVGIITQSALFGMLLPLQLEAVLQLLDPPSQIFPPTVATPDSPAGNAAQMLSDVAVKVYVVAVVGETENV